MASYSNNYTEDFDPWAYFEFCHRDLAENSEFTEFLKGFNDVFKDGRISGKRLLDMGTGSSIHSIIAASRHFDEIYLTDYIPKHLSILADWWGGKSSHMDHIIKYCIQLENSSQTVLDRNTEIREKIKGILYMDVTKSNPFTPSYLAPFDTIVSSFCLDSASHNWDEFAKAFSNVSAMLRVGGKFVFVGGIDITFYRVGDFKYKNPNINLNDLYSILESNNFEIECIETYKNTHPDRCDGSFYLAVARKL
ncbi:hypothetical protein ScPMuIL_017259 [Solemya velum]